MNGDALALLAGIREHPDDDLARLVFADWLDEHGVADWAEAIRTQIEATGERDKVRFSILSARADELIARHPLWDAAFAGDLAAVAGLGGLERLTVWGRHTSGAAWQALRRLTRLRHLALVGGPRGVDYSAVASLPSLTGLEVCGIPLSAPSLRRLLTAPSLRTVRCDTFLEFPIDDGLAAGIEASNLELDCKLDLLSRGGHFDRVLRLARPGVSSPARPRRPGGATIRRCDDPVSSRCPLSFRRPETASPHGTFSTSRAEESRSARHP